MRPGQIDSQEQKNVSTFPQQAGFCCLTRPGLFLSLALGGCILPGCAQLLGVKPLIEVPQRSEREITSSQAITTQSIATLSQTEDNKVNKMQELAKEVAKARILSIESITKDAVDKAKANPNAVANIVENSFVALDDTTAEFLTILKEVDGTKGYVAGLTEEYIKVGRISDLVKLASLAGQTYAISQAIPEAKRQFTAFARWTFSDLLPYIIGVAVPGVGGLVALGVKLVRSRRRGKEEEEALEATVEGNEYLMAEYGDKKVAGERTLRDEAERIWASKHSGVGKDMNRFVKKVRGKLGIVKPIRNTTPGGTINI